MWRSALCAEKGPPHWDIVVTFPKGSYYLQHVISGQLKLEEACEQVMRETLEAGVCCLSYTVQLRTIFTDGPLQVDLAPAALFVEPV